VTRTSAEPIRLRTPDPVIACLPIGHPPENTCRLMIRDKHVALVPQTGCRRLPRNRYCSRYLSGTTHAPAPTAIV